MRKLVLFASLTTALLCASVALAAGGGSHAHPATLADAARHTLAAGSFRFELAARIETAGSPPQVLHVRGASSPDARQIELRVAAVVAPGAQVAGPFAQEKADRHFVYVRSSLTVPQFGPLWVRERLAALARDSEELKMLRAATPQALLRALGRAQELNSGTSGGIFRAALPYNDPVVRSALEGIEGGIEFRDLHLTAWTGEDGYLRRLVVTGRTADERSLLTLTLTLRDHGRPVAVSPPGEGSFVDADLSRLSA
jgi:hypothetical protein